MSGDVILPAIYSRTIHISVGVIVTPKIRNIFLCINLERMYILVKDGNGGEEICGWSDVATTIEKSAGEHLVQGGATLHHACSATWAGTGSKILQTAPRP